MNVRKTVFYSIKATTVRFRALVVKDAVEASDSKAFYI